MIDDGYKAARETVYIPRAAFWTLASLFANQARRGDIFTGLVEKKQAPFVRMMLWREPELARGIPENELCVINSFYNATRWERETLLALNEAGANVETGLNLSMSHIADKYGEVPMMERLLATGKISDYSKAYALAVARKIGDEEKIALLQMHGAGELAMSPYHPAYVRNPG